MEINKKCFNNLLQALEELLKEKREFWEAEEVGVYAEPINTVYVGSMEGLLRYLYPRARDINYYGETLETAKEDIKSWFEESEYALPAFKVVVINKKERG